MDSLSGKFLLLIFIITLSSACLAAPTQTGSLRGIVTDSQSGLPLDAVSVTVLGAAGVYRGMSGENGVFEIVGIPPGSYRVILDRIGYKKTEEAAVRISAGVMLKVAYSMLVAPISVEGITVAEEELPAETAYGRSQNFINTQMAGGNDWHQVLATVPGVQLNAFGQVHTRGDHQLISFSMDDIQLPIVPNAEIGYLVSPRFLSGIDVETGGFNPSQMGQLGVVVNLDPIRARTTSEGVFFPFYGDHDQYGFYGYWVGRSDDSAWNYFAGLQESHTDLRLEAPTPHDQTLNNAGTDASGFVHIRYQGLHDSVRMAFGREVSNFEIPDTPDAAVAGVVQNEQAGNTFALISWTHLWSADLKMNANAAWLSSVQTVTHNGVFTPFVVANPVTMPNANAAGLPANPEDPGSPYLPLIDQNNAQVLFNMTASYAMTKEDLLEAGGKGDFITTQNDYNVLDAGGAGTLPSPHVDTSETFNAFNGMVFVMGHLHPSERWHVDVGGNLDHFNNGENIDVTRLSPFLNAAYSLSPSDEIRFSFNHVFNIPPIVPDLTGVLSALPEDANVYELSYEIHRPSWTFRFGPYLKNFANQIDGSLLLPFSSLPIFYPVNFVTSLDKGLEISASTRNKSGWNGFLSYLLSFAQSTSPGASPTSLDNPLYLDHDQRNTLDFGVSYSFPKGFYASLDNLYGSGFPQDAAAIYNLDGVSPFGITGRVSSFVSNLNIGWSGKDSLMGASLQVFNLFNNITPMTYLSDFTGTRFVKERSMVFNLLFRF